MTAGSGTLRSTAGSRRSAAPRRSGHRQRAEHRRQLQAGHRRTEDDLRERWRRRRAVGGVDRPRLRRLRRGQVGLCATSRSTTGRSRSASTPTWAWTSSRGSGPWRRLAASPTSPKAQPTWCSAPGCSTWTDAPVVDQRHDPGAAHHRALRHGDRQPQPVGRDRRRQGRLQARERQQLVHSVPPGRGRRQSQFTWQGIAGVGYQFGWGSVIAAWRYLDYDFKSGQGGAEA